MEIYVSVQSVTNPSPKLNTSLSWDHWVSQDRLKKWTEENQELAKSLKKEMESLRTPKPPAKASTNVKRRGDNSVRYSEERGAAAAGKKRGRDFEVEKVSRAHAPWVYPYFLFMSKTQEDAYVSKPAVRIIMPDLLKSILVDDWENVTKNLQLVKLPAEHSVESVLVDYYAEEKVRRGEPSPGLDILDEVIAGVREYFNKCLSRLLLYKFERPQFEEVAQRMNHAKDQYYSKEFKDIYGAEHLLRLFGKKLFTATTAPDPTCL
jgi:mortality factor 4-like protein 1